MIVVPKPEGKPGSTIAVAMVFEPFLLKELD
jgi:hypothetical protein